MLGLNGFNGFSHNFAKVYPETLDLKSHWT
jgi:hypothetical protein